MRPTPGPTVVGRERTGAGWTAKCTESFASRYEDSAALGSAVALGCGYRRRRHRRPWCCRRPAWWAQVIELSSLADSLLGQQRMGNSIAKQHRAIDCLGIRNRVGDTRDH